MSTSVPITKCMFCDGYVPASFDDVYIKHMNDHHRAFVNIQFLFQISLLSNDDLEELKSISHFSFFSIINKEHKTKTDETSEKENEIEIIKREDANDFLKIKEKIKTEESTPKLPEISSKANKRRKVKRTKYEKTLIQKQKKEPDLKLEGLNPSVPFGVCKDCGFIAEKGKQQLIDHIAINHDETKLDCEICGKKLMGKRRLKSHLYNHKTSLKEKVECPECHKFVKCLRFHQNIAHKEKQFSCDLCEKKFFSEARLKSHTVIHFDGRPFVCRFGCGFGSKSAGNRTKHEIHKHNAKSELDIKAMIESGELMVGPERQENSSS